MLKRYTKPPMDSVWVEQAKFDQWVESLLAVLYARVQKRQIDQESFDLISQSVDVNVERVHELDKEFQHDAQALIETVRESLRAAGINEMTTALMGARITSYDMEDPAFGVLIVKSLDLILLELEKLLITLKARASEFRRTKCIFMTHGQPAVPGFLGIKFCRWIASFERDRQWIRQARENIRVGKFSGAGGTYDELDPDIEEIACKRLGLEADEASSQIIQRDRHARVMTALAICACNISQAANELWGMCSYPRNEAREYFSPTQRGSSAMPHKKNPIKLEQLRGMSSPMRSYAMAALEHIMTWDERAIDQSSTERIIWPDATTLVHYMLTTLRETVGKMIFYPKRMQANLDYLQGIWAAQYVKNVLWDKGVFELKFFESGFEEPNRKCEILPTYKWIQLCAFVAWDQSTNQPVKPLRAVLIDQGIEIYLDEEELDPCFDLNHILRNADVIYSRFGI
ncbi:MAG: purB [Candidatus Berkelbacteria bacterium]|nr:purB [Candidatus Berkelbacteria bacterium]